MGEQVRSAGFMSYLPLLLAILHGIIFLFVLVATPVDVFKGKSGSHLNEENFCASMFGWKRCGSHPVTTGFHCGIKNNMGGAAAFAIISIFVTLATLILYILTIFDIFKRPLILLLMDAIACLTILISWGCVAGAYNQGKCEGLPRNSVRSNYNLAGSFGLMVTSWVLQVVAIIGIFFVPL